MMIKPELFKMAYKKLKSSLYYDKTQSIARDKLVEFEKNVPVTVKKYYKYYKNITVILRHCNSDRHQ